MDLDHDDSERLDSDSLPPARRMSLRSLGRWRPPQAWVRLLLLTVAVLVVAVSGAVVGQRSAGPVDAAVGPVDTRMTLRPMDGGDTVIEVPPLGSLRLDSHDGPLGLRVEVAGLDVAETRRLLSDPAALTDLQRTVGQDVRSGVVRAALWAAGASVLGALVLGFVAFRRVRRALACAATAAALVGAGGGAAAFTWNPDSIAEPQYEGLLASAPALVGDAADIVDRFDVYRGQLAKIVTNVSTLYAAGTTLPSFSPADDSVRLLHVSDIHLNPSAWDVIRSVSSQFQVDAVVDTGDLTDHGTSFETSFANGIASTGVKYVYVRGNHDSTAIQQAVASQRNAVVVDEGQVVEVEGLRITGWGDPRFTPNQETRDDTAADAAAVTGERLADAVRAQIAKSATPHIALVHDPTMAPPLDGLVPLALSGHRHERESYLLDKGTRVFVQGSTGAAGLRGLEHDEPTPIQLSVLYFDRATGSLQAWDDITLGGLGLASATIERHLPDEEERSPITPAPVTPPPSTAPTPSAPRG
jgi:predicted MPP superfamily phosphohydrolase